MNTSPKKRLFDFIVSKLNLSPNGTYCILDFGCGTGDFLGLLSKRVSANSRLFGLDASEQFIQSASDRYPEITFFCKKFDGKLDFPDASFDMIVTIDVFECISDKDALISEFDRTLKSGGKVLAAHWDWDTMLYSSESKDIARKAVTGFSDSKQPWMDNCDGHMGRKLWGLFEGSGKFQGKPDSFNLIETAYEAGTYGFDRMRDIAVLIDQGRIGREEYETLHDELIKRNSRRQYFFSVTSFMYWGRKIRAGGPESRI